MSKIITSHISDTHNNLTYKTGEGNILFHHGDATNMGTPYEVERFGNYLKSKLQHFDHIVYIPGNHDILFEEDEKLARSFLADPRIHVLINQSVHLCGFKIYGSPFSIRFMDWAFMKHGEELFKEWEKIPKDVEILLTHTPPFGILDYAGFSSGHLGCQNLMWRIENEYKDLLLHGFGHIHECNGIKERDNKVFLNAACSGSFHTMPHDAWQLIWENKQIIQVDRLE